MEVLKKIGGGLVFVLAVLAFIACLVGLIGSWVVKSALDQASLASVAMAIGYVDMAGQTLSNFDDSLADAERRVATVRTAAEDLQANGPESAVGQVVQRTVSEELVPRLARLAAAAERLRSGLAGLNQTIEQVNRVPLVKLPPVGDDLAALDQRLAEAGTQAAELQAGIKSMDGARLLATTGRIAERLGSARTTISATQQRLDVTRLALDRLGQLVLFWTTAGVWIFNALMLLFAAGQASLAVHAWGWMRGRGRSEAPAARPAGAV